MIQPFELSIGNLVYDTKGEVNIVCAETFKKFNYQIKPILLTEGWLIRFDLNRVAEGAAFYSIELEARNAIIRYVEALKGYYLEQINMPSMRIELKYVHTLQNAYQLITGEELKLKE